MFPICWAVVEGENTNSWCWFVQALAEDLTLVDGRGWTIISDQQKGLVEAIHTILPDAEHRKCARHVYANWKAKNKTDRVRKLFWFAVYACNEVHWNRATAELEAIEKSGDGSTPYTDFMAAEPRRFCRAFLRCYSKCDSVESNVCETWNGCIVKYKGLRTVDMLEGIRQYMMDRVVLKSEMFAKCTDTLPPRIRKRVEREKEEARLCVAKQTLNARCEVKKGGEGFIVDVTECTCSCGYWQLSGIPCCHAVSAISHLRREVDDYVNSYYHVYMASFAYNYGIPCLDGRQAWPASEGIPVHPPKTRSMPGRPKKKRRRSANEVEETRAQRNGVGEEVTRRGNLIHCSKCGGEGHNARSCKAPPVAEVVVERREQGNIQSGPPAAQESGQNTRRKRAIHCSKCQSSTHNARTCPLNRGNGVQDVILNVADRRTIERELRIATSGVGVYVNERTGNQPVRGPQPTVVDLHGSQPPPSQP
ncbi:unnamed protein product [Linum trigynum]|uniref:SWIM-type domain-containing protein n=1 Tax=Linum trigynum TaxID=586398 RepID=A0AAV2F525_9ROSI